MPRRGQSPDDNSSQKENSGVSIKVKSDKVKKEVKVKAENAKNDKGKQRARIEDDEDGDEDAEGEEDVEQQGMEAEQEDDEDDEQGEGSQRGRKRARLNNDGDSYPSQQEAAGNVRGRVTTLPRDVDGFIPGSIIRIQLRNFVTYDYVEFCPGPYLNMILGPNGTGKSSIACAICLGLNWSPSVLGRATEVNSFVKDGADKGHIEIELKGPKGKHNLIIRRNLSATSKGSTFTLNGNSATGREISNKMSELNVQVGNLCSFLPQDKVSEFAAMSPQQLLRETQRAAGDENLTAWHDTLISSGKELRQMLELMADERNQLKTMQERNEGLERDVQRYKERKKIEHDIELLQVLIPVQEYRDMRAKFMEAKKLQRKLHEKVTRLKAKNAPAHALLKKLDTQHKEYDRTRELMKKSTKSKFEKMQQKWTASEKLENEAEELTLRLERFKKEEKERAKKIKTAELEIVKLKAELEKPVEIEDQEELVAKMRQLNMKRQDVTMRETSLRDKLKANIDQKAMHQVQVDRGNDDLRALDDANVRKLQSLAKWDRDHHDAVLWLRNNRDKFKKEVFEPPFICLTVPDKSYMNAVEACFSTNQLKTFVAQCREDYDTFNHYINDEAALGRKVRINTWFRPYQEGSLPPPPMSEDELKNLGFDGYAIDYVNCPNGLRWFLMKDLNLHRTAIGLNGNRVDVANAMQAVARLGPNGEGGGATFIAGSTMNIVGRSRYGRRAIHNMAREVRQARNLVASTIDPEVKLKIERRIADGQREIQLIVDDEKQLKADYAKVQAEDAAFLKQAESLKARRQAITDANARLASLKSKLDRTEKHHKALLAAPSADVERGKVKKGLLDITKKRVKIAREYTELARSVITEQTETTRIGLEFLQVGANRAALVALCEKKDEKYNEALTEFTKADDAFQKIKAESKLVLEMSREVVGGISDELRAEYDEIEAVRIAYDKEKEKAEAEGRTPPPSDGVDLRTTDELLAELETQRNNLDLNLNTNPGVVEQYEKRKQEIENLTKTIEERGKKAGKIERDIKNARDNWQPALEKLVGSIGEKFSAAFDRIGCAGEIRVSEHEDYEKWAIDILVKFRDSEKLQLLTGQRQSGGERSLTTILYLMSLTEEARAPFSLVDEINQGMDQKAERNVHNSMVQVTCKPDSAQYFLITPKLLPDLEYHERMKVLCVNNGEWLPEERDLGNMMNMIEGFVQRRNRAANAV